MAVQGNTPAAFRTSYTSQNYLTSSDVETIHAKAEKQIDSKLFGRYGKEKLGIMPFIEENAQYEAATAQEFIHYEQDRTRSIVRVTDSYTSGGSGATFTVASTTPDYVEGFPTAANQTWYNNYTTGYSQTVREGDTIMADGIELQVFSASYGASATTQTFTVECTQSGETVPSGLENVELYISGRARSERSSGPDGRETRLIKYKNFIQTFDEAYEVSGAAMGTKSLVRGFANSDKWYMEGILNTRTNFDAMVEMALLTGKKVSSTNAAFNNMFKTEGIVPFVRNYGTEVAYNTNAFTLSDVDDMIDELIKYYGPNEYMLLQSQKFSRAWDDAFRTLNSSLNGGITYDQNMLNLGFRGIDRTNVAIYKKTLQGFSDDASLGSADSEYLNFGLMIPKGTTTSFDYNGGQAVEKATMVMRYLDVAGEDRGYKEMVTGGAGAANTNDTDYMKVTMRKRCGIELSGANLYGAFVGSAA
jgi:hypothetical protein